MMQIEPKADAAIGRRLAKHRRKASRSNRALCPRALGASPAEAGVRASEVARARRLLADANYPPPEVIEVIAGILARKGPRFWFTP
jgi:hypothetical protein